LTTEIPHEVYLALPREKSASKVDCPRRIFIFQSNDFRRRNRNPFDLQNRNQSLSEKKSPIVVNFVTESILMPCLKA
jgi:hypothetical protein